MGTAGRGHSSALLPSRLRAGRTPAFLYSEVEHMLIKIELMISLFNIRRQCFGRITVSLPFKFSAVYSISEYYRIFQRILRIASARTCTEGMKLTPLTSRKTFPKPLKGSPCV
jgi:hypothetical protein